MGRYRFAASFLKSDPISGSKRKVLRTIRVSPSMTKVTNGDEEDLVEASVELDVHEDERPTLKSHVERLSSVAEACPPEIVGIELDPAGR